MPTPSEWFTFKDWCKAKKFTPQHGYNLIRRGQLSVVKSGTRTYVTEGEDRRFDEACAVGAEEMEAPPQLQKAAASDGGP